MQAFYFIINAYIGDGNPVSYQDWIGVFNGDVLDDVIGGFWGFSVELDATTLGVGDVESIDGGITG